MRSRTTLFRAASALALIFLLEAAATSASRNSPPAWLWGCWKVERLLPVTDVSGVSPRQEQAIIGRRIVFSRTCARSGEKIVKGPNYSVKTLSAKEFFRLGYFPLSQIGVAAKRVTQVYLDLPDHLSDLDFPGNYVYLRDEHRDIVIAVEGDYFLAEKTGAAAGCKCATETQHSP